MPNLHLLDQISLRLLLSRSCKVRIVLGLMCLTFRSMRTLSQRRCRSLHQQLHFLATSPQLSKQDARIPKSEYSQASCQVPCSEVPASPIIHDDGNFARKSLSLKGHSAPLDLSPRQQISSSASAAPVGRVTEILLSCREVECWVP